MLKVNALSKYENYERILELRPGEFAVYENMKNRIWLTDPTDSGKEEDVGQVHVSVYCKNNPSIPQKPKGNSKIHKFS